MFNSCVNDTNESINIYINHMPKLSKLQETLIIIKERLTAYTNSYERNNYLHNYKDCFQFNKITDVLKELNLFDLHSNLYLSRSV